jgi:PIN domain nuclease of toxin-antitoxin system
MILTLKEYVSTLIKTEAQTERVLAISFWELKIWLIILAMDKIKINAPQARKLGEFFQVEPSLFRE